MSIQTDSFFSDGTGSYVIPAESAVNAWVTIRFRTAKGMRDVWLCSSQADPDTEPERIRMVLESEQKRFDFYKTRIRLTDQPLRYHFFARTENEFWFYDKLGVIQEERTEYDFCIVPGFFVPEWAKGAVMYQIFTDRFCNGDFSNSVKSGEYYYINRQTKAVDNWYKPPGYFDVADFYGGDLAGVIQKLDYLQELGVEVIYFNPLFVSASNHKYDTQDYDYIDPHFGVIIDDEDAILSPGDTDNSHAASYIRRVTSRRNLEASNQLFSSLVFNAHTRGMRVILDGVFNHCGSFHKWLDREGIYKNAKDYEPGAYYTKESPYHSFFRFEDEERFPCNDTYEGWWGHKTLPKLNYEDSPKLEEYILRVAKKWVSPPYNADGWRLDVAADLGHSEEYNHRFWKKFRTAVKEANPQAVIIAEHYGDPSAWLSGDQWDTVMNYDAFMEPVSWFLTGMEKHSENYKEYLFNNERTFSAMMRYNMARFLTPSLLCSMNQLSNHDHSRFLTRTSHKVGRAQQWTPQAASEGVDRGVLKEAVVIQMTWPGAPTIYYGDEAGLCGFTDPDNRRGYPWGREDKELISFHRDMIAIHRNSTALRSGSLRLLKSERGCLSYARFTEEEQYIILINNNEFSKTAIVDVWIAGIPDDATLIQIMYTTSDHYSMREIPYRAFDGVLKITLPKHCAVVLKHISGK